MIPRFCPWPERAAGSFAADLDTTGTIGGIMRGAPQHLRHSRLLRRRVVWLPEWLLHGGRIAMGDR